MLDLSSINFKDIYCTDEVSAKQSVRYENAIREFSKAFSSVPQAIFSAPGRTEIGGNHTDHQHGEVLAASINKDAIAVVAARDDNNVNILAEGFGMTNIDLYNLHIREDEKARLASDNCGDENYGILQQPRKRSRIGSVQMHHDLLCLSHSAIKFPFL